MKRQWLLIAALALAGGVAGVLAGRWLGGNMPAQDADRPPMDRSATQAQIRPAFELPGLDGNLHHIDEWDGQVILLNFWATWCAPCREEMPMLDELHDEYGERGFKVVGVALDTPGDVQAFVERLGIGYPILIDNTSGDDLARRYGNSQGVLPYSVLIDRDGTIREYLYGALEKAPLERRLETLL